MDPTALMYNQYYDMTLDGGYFLLYLVVAMMMFGGGMGGFGFGGILLPWMLMGQNNANNTNNDVQRNFDQLATSSAISNLSTAVSSGFSNAETAEAARHSALVNMLYSGQISDLERSFAAQTSINGGICDLSKDLLKCCRNRRLRSFRSSRNCFWALALFHSFRSAAQSGQYRMAL